MEMTIITVCVGSSCHLKGAHDFIKYLKETIEKYNLYDQIELKGSFCMGHCTEGVNIKINDELFSLKNIEELQKLFESRFLNNQ